MNDALQEKLDALEKAYNEDKVSSIWLLDTVKEILDYFKPLGRDRDV